MTTIAIITFVQKFLGYLNIRQKALDWMYLICTLIPLILLFKIVYGLWYNAHYVQLFLYSIACIALLYALIINIYYLYYNKRWKYDITNIIYQYIPQLFDESTKDTYKNNILKINYYQGSYIHVHQHIESLISKGSIISTQINGHWDITQGSLLPDEFVIKDTSLIIPILKQHQDIGEISYNQKFTPLAICLYGGYFTSKDGTRSFTPYEIGLVVQNNK